jgi:shikimate kinase
VNERNLVLTGFMGTGKTTVGRILADGLGRPFLDMDALIEARAGKPVARIFAEDGESEFRRMEAELCEELGRRRGLVIATGGGTLVDSGNRAALAVSSTLVCLNAGIEEILRRVGESTDRPMLGSDPRADVHRLLAHRQAAYATIPWQVETTGRSAHEVADQVMRLFGALTSRSSQPDGHPGGHGGSGDPAPGGPPLRSG